MKEERFFYDPALSGELPTEEAHHASRVLRLGQGDEIHLMDGKGTFCRAELTVVANHRVQYSILEREPQQPAWQGHLHLAMAPTKLMDRVEWFAEKATEIGFDELTFLDCQFSERRVVKEERIDKILISAVKQSRKAWKPTLHDMTRLRDFVSEEREGDKFICHCYDDMDRDFLFDALKPGVSSTVLIGPEGDFSMDEVRFALEHGYRGVSLGKSRLRTETAALVAVHMMQLKASSR